MSNDLDTPLYVQIYNTVLWSLMHLACLSHSCTRYIFFLPLGNFLYSNVLRGKNVAYLCVFLMIRHSPSWYELHNETKYTESFWILFVIFWQITYWNTSSTSRFACIFASETRSLHHNVSWVSWICEVICDCETWLKLFRQQVEKESQEPVGDSQSQLVSSCFSPRRRRRSGRTEVPKTPVYTW